MNVKVVGVCSLCTKIHKIKKHISKCILSWHLRCFVEENAEGIKAVPKSGDISLHLTPSTVSSEESKTTLLKEVVKLEYQLNKSLSCFPLLKWGYECLLLFKLVLTTKYYKIC